MNDNSANKSPETTSKESLPKKIKEKDWKKILFVVLLSIALYLEVVYATFFLVLVSAILFLVKGSLDPRVSTFSGALITVISGTLSYILFQTDDKPWPLSPWPTTAVSASTGSVVVEEAVVAAVVEEDGEGSSKD